MNLKKAQQVQKQIQNTINSLDQEPNAVDAMTTPNWANEVMHRLKEYDDMTKEVNALNHVLYNIRRAKGKANVESGINELLTDLAEVQANTDRLSMLLSDIEVADAKDVVMKKIELKEKTLGKENSLYSDNRVNVSIFTASYKEEKEKELRTLKKSKVALEDKILERNINTKIELAQEDMDLLARYDII